MQRRAPFDGVGKRRELLERLNVIPGVSLPADSITNRWPSLPCSALREEAALRQVLDALDWAVEQINMV